MRTLIGIFLVLASLSSSAMPDRAHVMMHEGRVKFQFGIDKNASNGSFELRSILEREGFTNNAGRVETDDALYPLEIYNYLYDNGTYIFTIMLPPEGDFFVDFNLGTVSFHGIAAQRLFEVVKKYGEPFSYPHLEQYRWGQEKNNYCDKNLTNGSEYRCHIKF